ncbi:MAG: restriction endonuclease subunit S, partial [Planctomycetes bacterium]|nr:restriction endonuclease subunit S [Planctomycetota bacterium]
EIRKESFYPIVRLIVLVPNKDLIGLSFLKYAASSIDFSNTGVSIPQLTVPMVREYEISLPPLLEQESIVAKLDALSDQTKKLAAIYQQKLAGLEELKKALLQKAFNGEL